VLSLPTDYGRKADRSRRAGYVPVQIDGKTTAVLEALAQSHGTTLFAVLRGVYGSLLGRLSRQDEVLFGFPVAGRDRRELEDLIGFFVNTLVLRVDVSGGPRVFDLIERVKERSLEALSHQDAPFDRLVEDLAVERSLSHTPIFQAMFAWLDQAETKFKFGEASLERLDVQLPTAKFDVTLSLGRGPSGSLEGIFEYDASLFTEATVCSWAAQFNRLIAGAIEGEDRLVGSIPLISPQERTQVIALFNDTQREIPNTTLPELFAAQVEKSPDAIALIFGDEEVSYRELDARANQLARYLIAKNIGPEDIVAIALDRSIEMVVSLLGVLKSGAAYLPLDPDYPVERLQFMLGDSNAKRLITTREIYDRLLSETDSRQASSTYPNAPAMSYHSADAKASEFSSSGGSTHVGKETGGSSHGERLALGAASSVSREDEACDQISAAFASQLLPAALLLDDDVLQAELATLSNASISDNDRVQPLTPDNLAYVIYTSGTTGKPKGAGNRQDAIINRIIWMQAKLALTYSDRVLQKTPFSFDVSVWEFLLPLFNGAQLVMARPGEHKNPQLLADLIAAEEITTLHFVPSMLSTFIESYDGSQLSS
ncbi:MAG: non-ribosomal peptide synthetase, partial [Methylocystis sp.]